MKKTFLILLITFNFFGNKSYSQKTISLNTISNNSNDLSRHSKIDVVCNLPDSNNLGYIPSDILNNRKNIKSSGAITTWFQNFVNNQFGSNANSKADALLWVIQDLSMGKDSTQKQAYSFVKLKADIYSGNELNYQLINTFDSTWVTTDANADFGKMIAQSFVELYKNSFGQRKGPANIRFQQSFAKLTGTKNDITAKIKASNRDAIVKANEYADGVYLSFDEFKNNSPSVRSFYTDVNSTTNKVSIYQIAVDSSSQLIQNAWGLSVNNELYFYTDGQLYPIEKSGNTFYMAKYLPFRTRKNQAIYWRNYVGAKQTDNNPYNDAHVLRKNVLTTKGVSLEATHLDFDLEDFTY